MIGVLGILVAAKRNGDLEWIRPPLERLGQHGFHVFPGLLRKVLEDVGEA